MTNIKFQLIWDEARRAAQTAAEEQYAKLGDFPEGSWPTLEGSAWLKIPVTSPFGRWAKEHAAPCDEDFHADLNEVQVWDAWLHNIYTPCVGVHEAAAKAARDVLARSLQTSAIGMGSQLD